MTIIRYHSTTRSFRHLPLLFMALALTLFTGCSDNPVADDHDDISIDDLEVSMSVVEGHVHTLSPATFQLEVTDHHGERVTDFEEITINRRLVGDDTWRDIEVLPTATGFEGTYTFSSSGEYELRVSGMMHGMTESQVMHEAAEHLHVGRAHEEVGSFRVEYESYPGHIHEGQTSSLTFYVLQDNPQGGDRIPVAGLTSEIHCSDPDGTEESHSAIEVEPGVFAADHLFAGAGEAHAEFHFTDAAGSPQSVDFHFDVAHGH